MPGSCHLRTERSSLCQGVFSPTVSRLMEESDDEDVMVTAPIIEESQGGDTIFVKPLAIRDPERLQLPPDITSASEPSPEASPEPTELPPSTVPVRMK
jgi:hypothetical protein